MSEPAAATVPSTRKQREKTVPVVTVDSFYNSHAEKLEMKLEGPRVGFHRKIREPTITAPASRFRVSTRISLRNGCRYWARRNILISRACLRRCASGDFERCASTRFRAWWYHADFILRMSWWL